MKPKNSLIIILIAAVLGGMLSGYLSYYSLFTSGCSETIISCGGNPIKFFGVPTCVYGLAMYIIVIIVTLIAWRKPSKKLMKLLIWQGVAGFLFSGLLSVYELFIQDTEVSVLPVCVYGFIFYTIILATSLLSIRNKQQNDW